MTTYRPVSHFYNTDQWSLRDLVHWCGLSWKDAPGFLGRSVSTVYRWQKNPPKHAIDTVLILGGYLGVLHPDWDGWRMDRASGALVDAHGREYDRSVVEHNPYLYQLLRITQNDLARLRGEKPRHPEEDNRLRAFARS
jgi:hypothetical protein